MIKKPIWASCRDSCDLLHNTGNTMFTKGGNFYHYHNPTVVFFFGNTHKKAKQEISLECSYIPSKDKTLIWRCTRIEYGQTYCTLATSNTLHHRQVAKWQCKCKDGHSHHYHSKDHTHIRRQCFILPAAYHRLLVYTELPSMQKPSPFLGL